MSNSPGDAGPDVVKAGPGRPKAAPEAEATPTARRGPKRPPRPGDAQNRGPSSPEPVPAKPAQAAKAVKPAKAAKTTKATTGAKAATVGRMPVDPTLTSPAEVAPSRPIKKQRTRAAAPAAPEPPLTTGRRGRRVKRVIRRIELWSVLKLSLVLFTCLYLVVLGTLVVIWGVAYSSGQIENLQEFLADVGLENYRFYGDRMFKACAAIGAVGVLACTVLSVLTAALINIISEMTGGIRVVVIEEEGPPRR